MLLVTYKRTIPPCNVNFSSLPQLYFNKDISTCNFSMVKLKVYVQGSIDISVAIGRLISLTSVQQDKEEQLDGITQETGEGKLSTKSLSGHSKNRTTMC